MKWFMITYTYKPESGSVDDWHHRVREFIAAIESHPELAGKIRYRCLQVRDSHDYVHLAEAADDDAIKVLNEQRWFKRYTEETKRVGGVVTVRGLDLIAATR